MKSLLFFWQCLGSPSERFSLICLRPPLVEKPYNNIWGQFVYYFFRSSLHPIISDTLVTGLSPGREALQQYMGAAAPAGT